MCTKQVAFILCFSFVVQGTSSLDVKPLIDIFLTGIDKSTNTLQQQINTIYAETNKQVNKSKSTIEEKTTEIIDIIESSLQGMEADGENSAKQCLNDLRDDIENKQQEIIDIIALCNETLSDTIKEVVDKTLNIYAEMKREFNSLSQEFATTTNLVEKSRVLLKVTNTIAEATMKTTKDTASRTTIILAYQKNLNLCISNNLRLFQMYANDTLKSIQKC